MTDYSSAEPHSTNPMPSQRGGIAAAYISRARQLYIDSTDDIEIDDSPDVSDAGYGAWVAAWVWVDREEVDPCAQD